MEKGGASRPPQNKSMISRRVSGRPPKLETKFPNGIPIVAYADLQEEAGLLLEIGGNNGMTAE